jgi:anaerobic selenocysteine-containing dehydrogenase
LSAITRWAVVSPAFQARPGTIARASGSSLSSRAVRTAAARRARSHDQFNTTIYSNNDRYRGLKGLRTVIFMNEDDMHDRGLGEFDQVDVRSFSGDGTGRAVYGCCAVGYELPRGCAAGYMPELNVLCGIADVSTQSDQPVTKHLVVDVTPSSPAATSK